MTSIRRARSGLVFVAVFSVAGVVSQAHAAPEPALVSHRLKISVERKPPWWVDGDSRMWIDERGAGFSQVKGQDKMPLAGVQFEGAVGHTRRAALQPAHPHGRSARKRRDRRGGLLGVSGRCSLRPVEAFGAMMPATWRGHRVGEGVGRGLRRS